MMTGYTDSRTSALYPRDYPYINSDAIFSVKESLIVDLSVTSEKHSTQYGVPVNTKLITYDFVLFTDQESADSVQRRAV